MDNTRELLEKAGQAIEARVARMDMGDTKGLVFTSHLTFSQCLAVLKDNFEDGMRLISQTDSIREACKHLQTLSENVSSLERAVRMSKRMNEEDRE